MTAALPVPPLDVLIVEDEALITMDLEMMLEDCGHHVVAEASSLEDVETLPDDLSAQLAFVDVHLAHDSSGLDVARLIRKRWGGVMIVFITANPLEIPSDYASADGVIPKPFSRAGLISAMHYIEEGVCRPPPLLPRPLSFLPAPKLMESWGV